jgi:hypothetical protein
MSISHKCSTGLLGLVLIGMAQFTHLSAQENHFPKSGQTWLYTQAGNPNIMNILGEIELSKALIVHYSPSSPEIWWANIGTSMFKSVWEMAEEVHTQLQSLQNHRTNMNEGDLWQDPVNNGWKKVHEPVGNLVYSCKSITKQIATRAPGLYQSLIQRGTSIEGENIEHTLSMGEVLSTDTNWYEQPPECTLSRLPTTSDPGFKPCTEASDGDAAASCEWSCKEDIQGSRWCTSVYTSEYAATPAQQERRKDVCSPDLRVCKRTLDESTFDTKELGDKVWTVYLYPKVVWSPRNVLTGGAIELIEHTTSSMLDGRRSALNALSNENGNPSGMGPQEQGMMSPILNDKESTIFTLRFRETDIFSLGTTIPGWASLKDHENGHWNARPWRAIQLSNGRKSPAEFTAYELLQWILMASSETNDDFNFFADISNQCGSDWYLEEKYLSDWIVDTRREQLSNPHISYCYADSISELKAITNGSEQRRREEDREPCALYTEPGHYSVDAHYLDFKNLEDKDVSEMIWKGCPDPYNETVGYIAGMYSKAIKRQYVNWYRPNRNEIREFLQKPFSRCGIDALKLWEDRYTRISDYYRHLDPQLFELASRKIESVEAAAERYADIQIKRGEQGLPVVMNQPGCMDELRWLTMYLTPTTGPHRP